MTQVILISVTIFTEAIMILPSKSHVEREAVGSNPTPCPINFMTRVAQWLERLLQNHYSPLVFFKAMIIFPSNLLIFRSQVRVLPFTPFFRECSSVGRAKEFKKLSITLFFKFLQAITNLPSNNGVRPPVEKVDTSRFINNLIYSGHDSPSFFR